MEYGYVVISGNVVNVFGIDVLFSWRVWVFGYDVIPGNVANVFGIDVLFLLMLVLFLLGVLPYQTKANQRTFGVNVQIYAINKS